MAVCVCSVVYFSLHASFDQCEYLSLSMLTFIYRIFLTFLEPFYLRSAVWVSCVYM